LLRKRKIHEAPGFLLFRQLQSFFCIPFGTAFGIYSIWVLLQDETLKLFSTRLVPAPMVYEGKKWANGRAQADDVTFVVMKMKQCVVLSRVFSCSVN